MNTAIAFVPSLTDVSDLKVGDLALDCFGRFSPVTEISFRGVDIKGAAYVGFYTATGPTSSMSGTYKAGELVRTVALTRGLTSAACSALEREMRSAGESRREVRS